METYSLNREIFEMNPWNPLVVETLVIYNQFNVDELCNLFTYLTLQSDFDFPIRWECQNYLQKVDRTLDAPEGENPRLEQTNKSLV